MKAINLLIELQRACSEATRSLKNYSDFGEGTYTVDAAPMIEVCSILSQLNGLNLQEVWVSCDERLPPIGEIVLVWFEYPNQKDSFECVLGQRDEKCWMVWAFNEFFYDAKVTHWRPRPSLPIHAT